jgi:hypothetical protein
MEWAQWSWMGIDMANKQNITQDLYKRLMAMTQKQSKSDCEPYPTFLEPTFAGPTTPSSTAMGQMNVKLPDNSDVVVTLWTDTAKLQIATLNAPDNSYTCYIPIQISANQILSVQPRHLYTNKLIMQPDGTIVAVVGF